MNVVLCVSSLLMLSIIYGSTIFSKKKQQLTSYLKHIWIFIQVVFGLVALEMGGSMMLGTCEQAYTSGLYAFLYIIGISTGFLLLGFGFAQKMKAMNVENTIDLFETKYRSSFLRKCASLLSILTTGGLLLGQVVAVKSLINALDIKSDFIFIILCFIIVIYAILGGLKAAGITYNTQLIYTLVLFTGIFGFCFFKEPPSFFLQMLTTQSFVASESISFSSLFSYIVMPALYYLTDQEFARPLFIINNKKMLTLSSLCAVFFMILFSFIPIYFGIKAHTAHLNITQGTTPLIPILKLLTNNIVLLLSVSSLAISLIAMIDYYLWSISLSITQELSFTFEWIRNNTSLNKIIVFLVGTTAIFGSYCTSSNAIQLLLSSYDLYDSCLIVPLLMSYFQSDLKKGSAIGSFLLGLTGFIIFKFISLPIPEQAASLLLSFIGFYIGGAIELIITRWQIIKPSKVLSV